MIKGSVEERQVGGKHLWQVLLSKTAAEKYLQGKDKNCPLGILSGRD